jgi:hypothetical protein
MAEIRGYTIRDARPKIAEVYWPYFIVRLQTTEGPQVELRFHKQALEYLPRKSKIVCREKHQNRCNSHTNTADPYVTTVLLLVRSHTGVVVMNWNLQLQV